MMRLLFFLFLLFPVSAHAAELDYNNFSKIPVQHEGRVKPFDSFARIFLRGFNGHDSLGSMSADAWLAETLFDPAQAIERPLFRILRPELLNLPPREKKYYSYAELAPALQQKSEALQSLMKTDEKFWSEDQRELARLKELSISYEQLLRSFSFLLPLNIEPPHALAKELKITEERPFTLQEYSRYERRIEEKVRAIVRRKGEDPALYTQEEQAVARFAFNMQILREAGENSLLLRIVPGQSAGDEWFSPWALRQSGQGSPQSAAYINLWQEMANAYIAQDQKNWNETTKRASEYAAAFASKPKITLELLYNNWHPLTLSMGFYLLAFLGLVLYTLHGKSWRVPALLCLSAGGLLHIATIVLRILILSRPPVGTLYESILFVAMICVIVGVVIEAIKKDGTGILSGSVSSLLLLFIAQSFAEDDTMKMLVAVLNTNFWLATHVLCITIGYGWCLIVSLLSHVWLVRRAMGKETSDLTAIKTLSAIALLFTAVGTILGGIWADQSWGRFWGWDPKENGALLIVLWLIWVLHGNISGHIKRLAFIAAMAGLSIIVALAWFGVNLLSVGLHSYGFITGVAAGLGAFCAFELLLIGLLCWRITQRQKAAA